MVLHPAVRLANDFAALVASFERNSGFGTKALGTIYNRLDKSGSETNSGIDRV